MNRDAYFRLWAAFSLMAASGFAGMVLNGCADEALVPGECGDQVLQAGEACDDGNGLPGDGCDSACAVESGWQCQTDLITVCLTICGDEVTAGTETCDDGNATSGDGCSATCAVEASTEVCGNGLDDNADGLTDCDDPVCEGGAECGGAENCRNGMDDDGDDLADCDDSDCEGVPVCTFGEICNNGIDDDGDVLFDCADPECDCDFGRCGDGRLNGTEECDTGQAALSDTEPDACRTDCTRPRCGDGVTDTAESCDDGADNGPTAVCLPSCERNLSASCGPTSAGNYVIPLGAWRTGEVSLDGALNSGTADDIAPPPECLGGRGFDSTIAVQLAAAGLYRFELEHLSGTTTLALLQTSFCNEGTLQCHAGSPGSTNGFLDVTVEAGGVIYLAVDSSVGEASTWSLSGRQLVETIADGEPCDPVSSVSVCSIGSFCDMDSSEPRCAAQAPTVVGLGEPCDLRGGSPSCGRAFVCDENARCEWAPGTTCDEPLGFEGDEVVVDEDGTLFVTATPLVGESPWRTRCGQTSQVVLYTYEPPADGSLLVSASSPSAAPAVVVSARSECELEVSEMECVGFAGEDSGVMELAVERGVPIVLAFGSSQPVDAIVALRPWVELGAACDVAGIENACRPPFLCNGAGRCIVPPAASCGAPLDLLTDSEGELLGRGLIHVIDASETIAAVRGTCGGAGDEYVTRLVVPEAGELVIRLNGAGADSRLHVRTSCVASSSELSCASGEEREPEIRIPVRAGQNLLIVADTESEIPSGTLVVTLEARQDLGEVCDTESLCLSDLFCEFISLSSSGTCRRPYVAIGGVCRPEAGDECLIGSVCVDLDGAGRRCLSIPATLGDLCSAERACVGELACGAAGDGPARCLETRTAGEVCDEAALVGCVSGLVCEDLLGESLCWPASVGVGELCGGRVQCSEGLACALAGEVEVTTCVSRPTLGEACAPGGLACTSGLECSLSLGSYLCSRRPVGEGEECNPAEGLFCAAGLFCTTPNPEPGTPGVCTR